MPQLAETLEVELESRYANGVKRSKDDQWNEENILLESSYLLEVLLEVQPCFVYRLSITKLRGLCERGPKYLTCVRNALWTLLLEERPSAECPPLDGAPLKWIGLRGEMPRRDWLWKMLDGIDRLTKRSRATLAAPEMDSANCLASAGDDEKSTAHASLSPDWYLPSVKVGQFQLPHFFTCGSIVFIGVRNSTRRNFAPEAPLHVVAFSGQAYGDTVVTYVGEELRTGDMEVWGQLLKLVAPLPLGSRLTVSAKELLTGLGRGTGGPAYKALRSEIARLQGARLTVRSSFAPMRQQFCEMFPDDELSKSKAPGAIEVSFQLLGASTTDGRSWSIAVPREVRIAFGPRLSSWFSEREYGLLTRRREGDTVKRLYLLYRSHAKAWPFTVQELRLYLGSMMSRDSDLRLSLDIAHDRLTSAGLIKGWRYGLSDRRRNCPDRVYEVDW